MVFFLRHLSYFLSLFSFFLGAGSLMVHFMIYLHLKSF